MQESSVTSWRPSETDLAVLGALEADPRASWSTVGEALGLSASTVARHWSGISRHRAAWISAAPGRAFIGVASTAFVLLAVAPRHRKAVLRRLCAEPVAATISTLDGHWFLLVDCFAPGPERLGAAIDGFASLTGVVDVDVLHAVTAHRNGSGWRSGTINAAQLSRLAGGGTGRVAAAGGVDETDHALLAALTVDGRASWLRLASVCGVSPQTAARRVRRLIGSEYAAVRCDSALHVRGLRHEVTVLLNTPLGSRAEVIALLAGRDDCRLVAEVMGRQSLLATVWLHRIDDLAGIEREIGRVAPDTVSTARLINVRTAKRVGHVLDRTGRWADTVPMAL